MASRASFSQAMRDECGEITARFRVRNCAASDPNLQILNDIVDMTCRHTEQEADIPPAPYDVTVMMSH